MHNYTKPPDQDIPCYAYIDGSFNASTGTIGYGVILYYKGTNFELSGSYKDPQIVSMESVGAEIEGAVAAIAKAVELGSKSIEIYHDFIGVEGWATGRWTASKEESKRYVAFIQNMKKIICISFHKVTAHTGVELHNRADKLAKQAAGITS